MKRTLLCAMIGIAAVAGAADAQEMDGMDMGTERASRFDFGIYGGGAYTTDWYESSIGRTNPDDGENGYGFELSSIFGANATLWFTPRFGVRGHFGYMPTELPSGNDEEFDDGLPQNNYLYDLDLVFRLPRIFLLSSVASNLYGWVGAGALTTDIASSGLREEIGFADDEDICEPAALARGVCLPTEGDNATVGQGVVGIGGDIVSLSNNIGLFAEVAVHGYDSPVHTSPGFTGFAESQQAEDKFAFTTRFVAGVKLALGSFAPPLPPPPPPLPPTPPAPPLPPAPVTQPIQVCVVQGPALANIDAVYNPTTGDTMVVVSGVERPFAEVYPATPPTYAAGAEFFINNQSVRFADRNYARFGLPRVITPAELTRVGDFQGVGLFAELGAGVQPEVLYVPVRPGCEFQPYQLQESIGRVRG